MRLQFIKSAFLILIVCVLTYSCSTKNKESDGKSKSDSKEINTSIFELQSGDILFQDSDCGPFCESIEKVTFGYKGSKFSHVGMVYSKGNDSLFVLEAITKGVVETHLDSFMIRSYDENNKSKVVVGRIKKEYKDLIPLAIDFAKNKVGYAYDDVFDINNEKYYCSELIYESYKYANKGTPIFKLQPMTYNNPETGQIFPIWKEYFQNLNVSVPEGLPGLNPGGMSKSNFIDIVHFYGKPEGYKEEIN